MYDIKHVATYILIIFEICATFTVRDLEYFNRQIFGCVSPLLWTTEFFFITQSSLRTCNKTACKEHENRVHSFLPKNVKLHGGPVIIISRSLS